MQFVRGKIWEFWPGDRSPAYGCTWGEGGRGGKKGGIGQVYAAVGRRSCSSARRRADGARSTSGMGRQLHQAWKADSAAGGVKGVQPLMIEFFLHFLVPKNQIG